MNRIMQHITQSLPFIKNKWLIVLLPTLWVFLLAIILEPFDFGQNGGKTWIAISYAGVAAISCTFVIYGFPLLFQTYCTPNKFTNGKFYLACISIIVIAAILCCVVTYYIAMIEKTEVTHSTIQRFCNWFFFISFIALLPIMIVYFLLRNMKLKENQQELEQNLDLGLPLFDNREHTIVLGEKSKGPLKIPLDKLLYIEASGNYTTAFFIQNDSIQQKQFRKTLIQVINDFDAHPQMVRCHRSFVVNIENVAFAQKIQPSQLIVIFSGTKIPVSRSYIKAVRENLTR